MRSLTVEYQRFGDPTGVVRLSDRYIRTVGDTAPAQEVGFELPQENLDHAMAALDYGNFERSGDPQGTRRTAERFLEDVAPYLERFLLGGELPIGGDGLCQLDIVTRALELAQLPFEVLEESRPDLVVTRRIRQPWPPPEVVRDDVPRVLFAWAEPKRSARSRRRMTVPHERHRELLGRLLQDWGGLDGGAVVEVANATREKLENALGEGRFTHGHLLAHGVGPDGRGVQPGERIDIERKPPPTTLLALEGEDGTLDRCPPEKLAALFSRFPRPETFAIATCHSGEVAPIRSGGTLAHVLHAAGVPIVLASQLALTQEGSDELIRTFLDRVIEGVDPRQALRDCRDALRASVEKTYYDRVALVGYIHVDDGLEQRLRERRFKVALARLKAISKDANARLARAVEAVSGAKGVTEEQRAEAEGIRQRFAEVRNGLAELEPDPALTKAQLEELRGLQASSLKRESEAAWKLGRVLSGADARQWLDHSHSALQEAAKAYRRAAEVSRDHHWTWVQWLVLEAVQQGSLRDREADWIVAVAAAHDAAQRKPPEGATESERKDIAEQAVWGWGSLCELNLLARLAGRGDAIAEAEGCLDELVSGSRGLRDDFPIASTLDQLARYGDWWGADSAWKLPPDVVAGAAKLHAHLKARSEEA